MCDESSESSLWLYGVIFGILSSTCTNLGVNLQKYSFLCEVKRSEKEKRSYVSQPKWLGGLVMVVAGGLLDFVALGFAPQSLITPVGGFTMVANIFFAHYFLDEAVNRSDAIATALIMGGVVQVALFADKNETCYTVDELVSFYARTAFIIYAIVVCILFFSFLYLVKHIEHILELYGPKSDKYTKFRRIHPILYPALSGLFGSQSVLFAKTTIELLKTLTRDNHFVQFRTYSTACTMLLCILLQIHWLARGLEKFDAVFIVPVFQCFFITISIVGGGVYFNEFNGMSVFQLSMFLIGVIITLAGVFLMSKRQMNESDLDDTSTSTEIEEIDEIEENEEIQYVKPTDFSNEDPSDQIILVEVETDNRKAVTMNKNQTNSLGIASSMQIV